MARAAFVIAAFLLSAAAGAASLAPAIADAIARLETNRATLASLDTRIAKLEQRLAALGTDPVGNADAIADVESTLATRRAERTTTAARVDTLAARLLEQREEFVTTTDVHKADLAMHVSALRTLEEDRALLQRRVNALQARVQELGAEKNPDSTRIAELSARLASRQAALDEKLAEIATARTAFSRFEIAATGGGGSATLSWSVPTTRENGEPLSAAELAGYEIYVLAESTGKTETIVLEDPQASRYTVTGLATDTYHFSMAAKDSSGNLSALSSVVSKTIAP